MKKLYQDHNISEVTPIIVSNNPLINGTLSSTKVVKSYVYIIAESSIDAKIKAYPNSIEPDEIYALEVSEETIEGEINHCKELIEYWNKKDGLEKMVEKIDEVIIPRQKNLIKHYEKILEEFEGTK
jgi:hypothetical protein